MQLAQVTLPNGYQAEESWSRAVWLRPWCGADEIALAGIDAATLPPVVRATTLLSRCVYVADGARRPGRAFVRALAAGDREALLLHLRRVTLGDRLSCVLSCPACGSLMDLDLDVRDLLVAPSSVDSARHEARLTTASGTVRVGFRLPSGADLEHVVALARRDPAGAVRVVAERCVDRIEEDSTGAARPLVDELIDPLVAAMGERDPQAEILLDAACPECGARATAPFDTASYVLDEISRHLDALLREVHVLASHYHWSERQILRLPARRRRTYLQYIAAAQEPVWRPA